ncbi:MAG: ABC transporter permease [Methanolobus sp.]|nr:ABC transporter permease [Methanolobus sp.]
MNLSETWIVGEDEILRGSKNKSLFFGGVFILLCFVAIHYSASILSLFSNNINDIPYHLIVYLVVLFIGPFIILITSFDSVSSEMETGSIRYIISKIDRTSFILGKFLALFVVFTSAAFVVAVIGQIYLYFSSNVFQIEKSIVLWVFSSLFLGCFISIFLFVSTLSINSKTSFIMSVVFLGILVFLFFQGDDSYLKYLTPYFYGVQNMKILSGFTNEIEYTKVLTSIFSMLLYKTVFLSMSLVALKRRDL